MGFTLGTPSYMAPEQVMGQNLSPSVDIYSFGILLFELFTGVKPIRGADVGEVFRKIINEPIDFTPLEKSGVTPRIVTLVRKLTAKKPEDRIGSFTEIVEELSSIGPGMASAPPAPTKPAARVKMGDRPWLIPVAALVTLLVLAGLFFGLRHDAGEPVPSASVTPEGMVLIPPGEFLFGEQAKAVDLPGYWIDRTEVSVAAYAEFAAATGRPAPEGLPDHPVTNVTIDDARAYAAWAGKRLPTTQEWEKAARGVDGRAYPWGNEANPDMANVAGNRETEGHLLPVDSMPSGASPFGVLNMVGNASELVLEFVQPTASDVERFAILLSPPPTAEESWCLVRGGSTNAPLPENAAFWAESVPARFSAEYLGFRCVRDRATE